MPPKGIVLFCYRNGVCLNGSGGSDFGGFRFFLATAFFNRCSTGRVYFVPFALPPLGLIAVSGLSVNGSTAG